jgi:hypothetical protein
MPSAQHASILKLENTEETSIYPSIGILPVMTWNVLIAEIYFTFLKNLEILCVYIEPMDYNQIAKERYHQKAVC